MIDSQQTLQGTLFLVLLLYVSFYYSLLAHYFKSLHRIQITADLERSTVAEVRWDFFDCWALLNPAHSFLLSDIGCRSAKAQASDITTEMHAWLRLQPTNSANGWDFLIVVFSVVLTPCLCISLATWARWYAAARDHRSHQPLEDEEWLASRGRAISRQRTTSGWTLEAVSYFWWFYCIPLPKSSAHCLYSLHLRIHVRTWR